MDKHLENKSSSTHRTEENNLKEGRNYGFDREYGLNELLPISVVSDLCEEIYKLAPVPVLVLMPDGAMFFAKGSMPPEDMESINRILKGERIDTPKTFRLNKRKMTIFPIVHEFETMGFLVMGHEINGEESRYQVIPFGYLLLRTFTHLIVHRYQYELTAGLHVQVVEESNACLEEKATIIEKSEQKYRKLAENLEIEVQKKARKIKETQARLMQQEKMASIGQLAAGVAHEINNPMGFINSNLNSLKGYEKETRSLIGEYRSFFSRFKDAVATEEGLTAISEGLERIKKIEKEMDIDFVLEDLPNLITESMEGAERIKKIVMDLKDFAHPGEDQLQSADINRSLDSTLNVAWNELKYKASVTKEYGKLPQVQCYPQQLNQVFLNLLVNAAQAIEKKGEIRIRTRAIDGYVEIKISDTGVGIPEESLSKIFDPFFTTKEVGKGTGLGLNVAYNIMMKHKGSIDVQSEVGKGTTFTVRIPVEGH